MPNAANYDPVKAHEYYERTKKLKGRQKGNNDSKGSRQGKSDKPTVSQQTSSSNATVTRAKAKVVALTKALSEARQALSEKRKAEAESAKENSDSKTTVKERAASKKYRDTHKAELAAKREKESDSSSSTSVSSMTVDELVHRVSRIQTALSEAKRQLAEATRSFGHLAHADLINPALTLDDITLSHSTAERTPPWKQRISVAMPLETI